MLHNFQHISVCTSLLTTRCDYRLNTSSNSAKNVITPFYFTQEQAKQKIPFFRKKGGDRTANSLLTITLASYRWDGSQARAHTTSSGGQPNDTIFIVGRNIPNERPTKCAP